MAGANSNSPWVVVSFLLVTVSAVGLIIGLFQDRVEWIWIAIASGFGAMVALGVGAVLNQRSSPEQSRDTTRPPRSDDDRHESRTGQPPPQSDRRNEVSALYAVLGVASTASQEEIRRAYRVRARLLHPDRHGNAGDDVHAEAQREMARLNEAWQVLGDPKRREAYDRSRSTTR